MTAYEAVARGRTASDLRYAIRKHGWMFPDAPDWWLRRHGPINQRIDAIMKRLTRNKALDRAEAQKLAARIADRLGYQRFRFGYLSAFGPGFGHYFRGRYTSPLLPPAPDGPYCDVLTHATRAPDGAPCCEVCGRTAGVRYRADVHGWDWERRKNGVIPLSEMRRASKTELCTACWNRARAVKRRLDIGDELRRLVMRLDKEARSGKHQND